MDLGIPSEAMLRCASRSGRHSIWWARQRGKSMSMRRSGWICPSGLCLPHSLTSHLPGLLGNGDLRVLASSIEEFSSAWAVDSLNADHVWSTCGKPLSLFPMCIRSLGRLINGTAPIDFNPILFFTDIALDQRSHVYHPFSSCCWASQGRRLVSLISTLIIALRTTRRYRGISYVCNEGTAGAG
jgi:hypothetical protein